MKRILITLILIPLINILLPLSAFAADLPTDIFVGDPAYTELKKCLADPPVFNPSANPPVYNLMICYDGLSKNLKQISNEKEARFFVQNVCNNGFDYNLTCVRHYVQLYQATNRCDFFQDDELKQICLSPNEDWSYKHEQARIKENTISSIESAAKLKASLDALPPPPQSVLEANFPPDFPVPWLGIANAADLPTDIYIGDPVYSELGKCLLDPPSKNPLICYDGFNRNIKQISNEKEAIFYAKNVCGRGPESDRICIKRYTELYQAPNRCDFFQNKKLKQMCLYPYMDYWKNRDIEALAQQMYRGQEPLAAPPAITKAKTLQDQLIFWAKIIVLAATSILILLILKRRIAKNHLKPNLKKILLTVFMLLAPFPFFIFFIFGTAPVLLSLYLFLAIFLSTGNVFEYTLGLGSLVLFIIGILLEYVVVCVINSFIRKITQNTNIQWVITILICIFLLILALQNVYIVYSGNGGTLVGEYNILTIWSD